MNRETIIRSIVEREMRRQPLGEEAVREEEPELHRQACDLFGTWETALRYAGVDLWRMKVTWSREYIIRWIQDRLRERYNLAAMRVKQNHPRIFQAAQKHFGTWRQALLTAGVDLKRAQLRVSKFRRHDKEKIFAELRAWEASGHSLRWCDICLQNRVLAITAKGLFNSWRKVLLAAGLVSEQQLTHWPQFARKQQIVLAIQKRQNEGLALNQNAVHEDNVALLWSTRRHFGSWEQALAAAGVPQPEAPKAPDSTNLLT